MKRYSFLLILTAVAALCICPAVSEENPGDWVAAGEGWSWDLGAYNTFEGELDISEFIGQDISVEMSADLSYDPETEQDSMPVFTIVNGKRIVMLKQTNTIRCTPDEENPILKYSGRIRLPEKEHVSKITFQHRLLNENGEELKTAACRIDDGDSAAKGSGNTFYIRFRTGTITLILGIAAAAVWCTAVIRFVRIRKCRRTGE